MKKINLVLFSLVIAFGYGWSSSSDGDVVMKKSKTLPSNCSKALDMVEKIQKSSPNVYVPKDFVAQSRYINTAANKGKHEWE
jgi:hypothetical protein